MAGGRPSLLTEQVLAKVQQMADLGLPPGLMYSRLGIDRATWKRWMSKGREEDSTTLHGQLCAIINNGASELAERYLKSLHGQAEAGNVNAITWLVTHHPILREHFSDAAAERRTERKTVSTVLEAVAATGLTPDQEHTLLLQMQARGLGAAQGEAEQ